MGCDDNCFKLLGSDGLSYPVARILGSSLVFLQPHISVSLGLFAILPNGVVPEKMIYDYGTYHIVANA